MPTHAKRSSVEERINNGNAQNIIDLEKQQKRSDVADGQAPQPKSEEEEDKWTVKWDGSDDPGDPLNTPRWRKWYVRRWYQKVIAKHRLMTFLLAGACVCVTCCSSMAGSTYTGMREEFGVGEEVCILSISLFVAGLGTGPREYLFIKTPRSRSKYDSMLNVVFLGPCSEFIGRSKVLYFSFLAFFRE